MSPLMRSMLALAVVIALFAWRGGVFATEIDASVLRAGGPDPCAQTARCVAVYLAPWCPQCRKSHDLVEELRKRTAGSSEVGFKVIVGRDEREALERYARTLGGTVFFDDDGGFYRQLGASGVPAWVSWDRRGRLGGTLYGRPVGAPTPALADHLGEALGVPDLL